jgi:hypothetical protein
VVNERTRRMDALHGRRPSRDSDSGDNRMMDALKEYWAIVAGAVAALVWLMRLESRSLFNEREIKRLSAQHEKDLIKLDSRLHEISQDIKTLLQRR